MLILWSVETQGRNARRVLQICKIMLPAFQKPPQLMENIFLDPEFWCFIRAYNNVFSFTSMGTVDHPTLQVDESVAGLGGIYTL